MDIWVWIVISVFGPIIVVTGIRKFWNHKFFALPPPVPAQDWTHPERCLGQHWRN